MGIVALSKITWYGLIRDKENTLEKLQDLGCLHILPLSRDIPLREAPGASQQTQEALQFLLQTSSQRPQVRESKDFDAALMERKTLDLRDSAHRLRETRDALLERIAALKPWGDFTFLPLKQTGGLRFWFYIVPLQEMKEVYPRKGAWKVVSHDHRFCYVVIISKDEPEGMPVARCRTGSESLSELKERLALTEVLLEEADEEKKDLTRWIELLLTSQYRLKNQALRSEVSTQTFNQDQLFALQAWAPKKNLKNLKHIALESHAALLELEPAAEEAVPTLLENKPIIAGGQNLVTFYMTPGYWMWDPSVIVFFSFSVFFAMILSDAGYAFILALFAVWKWKALSRNENSRHMRDLLTVILSFSIVWGIMVGSYLGMSPPSDSFLHRLKILDLNDSKTMMLLSVSIGVFHIVLANLIEARRVWKSGKAGVPLGWAAIILGGMMLWLKVSVPGIVFMSAGALMLLCFSSSDANIFKRLLAGIFQFARFNSAFGDILSYLRLFALGLASASLAITFNQLARQVQEALPGFGIIPAALIFVFGHILNLVLSLMSAVVHGLRLNVIEFFNWSMYEEGKPFRPFAQAPKIGDI
jgi:V/A-type H+/Na+-transporting ATPase subunit I